ncbi:MAG: ketoacyl-ACP synthase III [Bryobacterales bacterium]|nr:ketoacyl-ACP synthase III [Bryobacterales bacterium]
MPQPKISAVGTFVPSHVLTNTDLEKMVETSDEWILTRTGISERHIAAPDEATSDLAARAASAALAEAGAPASSIDAIIVSTVTPDMFFPATACLVQHKIGATKAWGFDLSAACAGFIFGITTAANLVMAGTQKRVLVIGADTMSRIIDYSDRATCVLFGDGAGAFLIEPSTEEGLGFIGSHNEIDGSGGDSLKMPAGGSRIPSSVDTVQKRLHYVHQDGQAVFKFAVRKTQEACLTVLEKFNLRPEDIKLLVPHQANQRIILAAAERLGLSRDRVVINIGKYGNTTAATIPLATRQALDEGRIQKGDIVLFAAVGAGFTVGASLWRWA